MTTRREHELLFRYSSNLTKLRQEESPDERATAQAEELRNAIESHNKIGRRKAAARAVHTWRSLPLDLQDKHIRLLSGIWNCHLLSGELELAIRAAERLISKGKRTRRQTLEAEGLLAQGLLSLVRGKPREAMVTLELSRALFTSADNNQIDIVRVSILLADAYSFVGDKESALGLLKRVRKSCLELEDVPLLAAASQTLGILHSECGDFVDAINCFEFVTRSAKVLSSEKRLLRGQLGLSKCFLRIGLIKKGEELARTALESAVELELDREIALANEYISDAHVARSEWLMALKRLGKVNRYAVYLASSSDIKCELHRKLAELWISKKHTRYASLHVRKGLAASGGGSTEDVKALERLRLSCAWQENRSDSVVKGLIAHAEEVRTLGLGYEYLVTAKQIVSCGQDSGKLDLARRWARRVEFALEACGITAMSQEEDVSASQTSAGILGHPALVNELPKVNLAEFGIVTRSMRIEEQAGLVAKLAPTNVPVLITGESGTGKELFARLVHSLSDRKDASFLAVNCGALPSALLESELFGYKRGAFTGAVSDRIGLFRSAHQGTLFLDEIGEMPVSAQTKLLRVLEVGEYRRVGDARNEIVDVRIVVATNIDLKKAVFDGVFRRDLYYRLKGLEIHLPPLSERLDDVPVLAEHFLTRANQRQGKDLGLPFETKQWMMGVEWSGNVRELKLSVERAVAIAPRSGDLRPHHFVSTEGHIPRKSLPSELEEIERARVNNALRVAGWNVTTAAKLLGITRTTLSSRLKRLGIKRPKLK